MTETAYDLISIGAHPDDVEVGTGGVLLALNDAGYRTGIVYLTAGEMGTGGTPEIRAEEAFQAARVLGSDLLETFDWGDCRLFDTFERRIELAGLIRRYRPTIILTPYPHVGHGKRQSHPDHVAAGQITINAANYATLKKMPIDGEPHRVKQVFHYFLPPGLSPNFVVDITAQYERWLEALRCHRSQFLNPEKSRDYMWSLESMARSFGQQAGCRYGQGFYNVEPIRIVDLFDLVK
ncbi:MAG: bacillithiol biosynthesis deacetylase BshB1 [candidate division Zixibacteria bacterium]|nr:bacillithiol biosynthesis deacetylase BshB1 [candidate division Zixibacteria bacterium]